MATLRTIKKRIKATKSVAQITRAMEAVSAVKMRRSQRAALAARPYALAALEILRATLGSLSKEELEENIFLKERSVVNACLVVVTSDKGLAGQFNAAVIRMAEEILRDSKIPMSLVTVGRKAKDHFERRGVTVTDSFEESGDFVSPNETVPISRMLHELFLTRRADEVTLLYTNFITAMKQEVVRRRILPLSKDAVEEIIDSIIPESGLYSGVPRALERGDLLTAESGMTFEPSAKEVLESLVPTLLDIEVYHSILEANASEHSARMIAMRQASENADELQDELSRSYNKLRQAGITRELVEITAGREALESAG